MLLGLSKKLYYGGSVKTFEVEADVNLSIFLHPGNIFVLISW